MHIASLEPMILRLLRVQGGIFVINVPIMTAYSECLGGSSIFEFTLIENDNLRL